MAEAPSSSSSLPVAERKRSREASPSDTRASKPKAATTTVAASKTTTTVADGSDLPASTSLLSCALRKELSALLKHSTEQEKKEVNKAGQSNELPPRFPTHKVGALEMYHRFPEAYDLFMRRHDCSAVERFLVQDVVLPRIMATETVSSSSSSCAEARAPFVRVADFGCGTGRIACMVVPHPVVKAVYAYDLETPMLKRCLVNVAEAFRTSRLKPECGGDNAHGTMDGIRLLPVASDNGGPIIFPAPSPASAASTTPDETTEKTGVASSESSQQLLDLCLRPCPFQLIQSGFLRGRTQTGKAGDGSVSCAWAPHPQCQLVVCAWSLSFVMRLQWGETNWHAAVDAVVEEMVALLDNTTSDAALVVIETLGNLSPTPTRQNTLMQRLEEVHGFTREWVRTDYTFQSVEEAVKMTQFFFGSKISSQMAQEQLSVLMECTGIWIKWKPKADLTQ